MCVCVYVCVCVCVVLCCFFVVGERLIAEECFAKPQLYTVFNCSVSVFGLV